MNDTAEKSVAIYENDAAIKQLISVSSYRFGVSDAILVNAHYHEKTADYSTMEGLDIALELVNDGRPLVVYSVFPSEYHRFVEDVRYHALKGYPHVEFMDIIGSVVRIAEAVSRARSKTRPADPLAIELFNFKCTEDRIAVLKHDFQHAHTPDALVRWLERARAQGFSGGDSSVMEAVRFWHPEMQNSFHGRELRGLFCDIQGTLLDVRGNINKKLSNYLREQSKEMPITLWTGGNTEKFRLELSKHIPWKITSKYFFHGATVQLAIDDNPKEILERDYGIIATSLIKAPQDLFDMGLL
jgi:hypothetical protein